MCGDGIPQKYQNNLKSMIKERGYKLYEVADGTSIPLRTLHDYCAGRVPNPKKEVRGHRSIS